MREIQTVLRWTMHTCIPFSLPCVICFTLSLPRPSPPCGHNAERLPRIRRQAIPSSLWSPRLASLRLSQRGIQRIPSPACKTTGDQRDNLRCRPALCLFHPPSTPIPPHFRRGQKSTPLSLVPGRGNFRQVSAAAQLRQVLSLFRANGLYHRDSAHNLPSSPACFRLLYLRGARQLPSRPARARFARSAWKANRRRLWLART